MLPTREQQSDQLEDFPRHRPQHLDSAQYMF